MKLTPGAPKLENKEGEFDWRENSKTRKVWINQFSHQNATERSKSCFGTLRRFVNLCLIGFKCFWSREVCASEMTSETRGFNFGLLVNLAFVSRFN